MPARGTQGVSHDRTATAWQQVAPATISERRMMKKTAQPEHSYTGYVPKWLQEPEQDAKPPTRQPPILGYTGHVRRPEDRIGTTFTKGLEVARQAVPTQPTNQQERSKVRVDAKMHIPPPVMSKRSGYGAFADASAYGQFLEAPDMVSPRSGYGAFDGASGYGEFLQAPSSGYGAFADNGSGYGDFVMAPGSGYGAFDGASGYGEFLDRPQTNGSGYGAFDAGKSDGYGDFMSPRSAYGEFDEASGYGAFMEAPSVTAASKMTQEPARKMVVRVNDTLYRQYQLSVKTIGGEQQVSKLLDTFAATIGQRYHKRTELLQAIKRSFEKYEAQNHGQLMKPHLKEALLQLACVFTDDQLMALMSVYDHECRGTVRMDDMLTELARRVQ